MSGKVKSLETAQKACEFAASIAGSVIDGTACLYANHALHHARIARLVESEPHRAAYLKLARALCSAALAAEACLNAGE